MLGLPALSLSIGEAELPSLQHGGMAGYFVAWNDLHGIASEANASFIVRWREISQNLEAVANGAQQASYVDFSLWKMAVKKAGTMSSADVRVALNGLKLRATSGFKLAVTEDLAHMPAGHRRRDPIGWEHHPRLADPNDARSRGASVKGAG